MTYCVGILVSDGLVMIADTRTNAGIDNIATFRKLHLFEEPGERALAVATSGNLSVSQSVLSVLQEGLVNPDTGQTETLYSVPTLLAAAHLIGRVIRKVYELDGPALEQHGLSFDIKVLLGGQIGHGAMRLFHVYSEGNAIEATVDTPFLQIGEPKYGKPILDRAISHDVDVRDALKIGLISMDSTLQSNLSVGLPVDIVVVRRDERRAGVCCRITDQDPYFRDLRERWSTALRAAHQSIPHPPYAQHI
jgi:putative proteasome-type protease